MNRHRAKKGTILIVSLWIVAILSLLAIGIGHRLSLEIRLLHNHLDSVKAFYIAKAGIERAVGERAIILEKSKIIYDDGYNQSWLNNETIFKEVSFGEGVYTIQNQDLPDMYGMSDEQGKININNASFDILKGLFKQVLQSDTEAANIASAIIDWHDEDNNVYQEPGTNIPIGAEEAYYQSLDKPYRPGNSDFATIEEILLVRGMTPEIFYGKDLNENGLIDRDEEGIAKYITVWGDEKGAININTAPRIVLVAALGEILADYIIGFRQQGTGKIGEKWFIAVPVNEPITENLDKLRNIRDTNPDFASEDQAVLWSTLKTKEETGTIGVRSSFFKINSTGEVKGIKRTIEAVVKFTDTSGAYKFLSWQQN